MIKKFISRSRIDTKKCPRKFYHSYLDGGVGYMEGGKNLDPLGFGIAVHAALAELFATNDLSLALSVIDKEMDPYVPTKEEDIWDAREVEEMRALGKALLMGWFRTKHKKFLEKYEVLLIEKEIETPLASNLILLGIPDLVVRDRSTGYIIGINFKTAASFWDWSTQWIYDVQAWTEAISIEKELGEKVRAYEYLGFLKGAKRQGSYSSPLIWGYRESDGTYTDKYRSGREKFATWKEDFPNNPFPSPLERWINWLPFDRVAESFISSNPIFTHEGMVEEWLEGIVRWETDAQHINSVGTNADKMAFFEQRFSKYNCKGCAFKDVCFKQADVAALVQTGRLIKRDSPISRRDSLLEATE